MCDTSVWSRPMSMSRCPNVVPIVSLVVMFMSGLRGISLARLLVAVSASTEFAPVLPTLEGLRDYFYVSPVPSCQVILNGEKAKVGIRLPEPSCSRDCQLA